MVLDTLEAIAGGALVFVLPGLALNRALFPDWRYRGPSASTRAVETAVMSLFGSVALTVLVGFALANGPGLSFRAGWSDPVLEAVLAGITVALVGIAALRGAFRAEPPTAPPPEPAPGEANGWERLGEFGRVEERLRSARRALVTARSAAEQDRWRAEVRALETERDALRQRREVELGLA